jgi:hypothetical protein
VRSTLPATLAVAAILATAGCTSTPETSPSPTATPTPTATETPEPEPTFLGGEVTATLAPPSAVGGDLGGVANEATATRVGQAAIDLVRQSLADGTSLPWDGLDAGTAQDLLAAVPDGAVIDASVTAVQGGLYVTVVAGPLAVTFTATDGDDLVAVAVQEV